MRRGNNTAIATLTVAFREQVDVKEISAEARRDNGFTTTLRKDDIDALSDDPDEMAEQLMQMAGPGAQIFIDGFRGGRLPPKDQIQQIRFNTNSFSAEYHEAGMVRIEVITKPGMGNWRGNYQLRLPRRVAERDQQVRDRAQGPEQQKRFMFNFAGTDRQGQDRPVDRRRRQHVLRRADHRRADADRRRSTIRCGARSTASTSPCASSRCSGRPARFAREYSRRDNTRSNLGVGDFDLARARLRRSRRSTDTLRVRNTRTIGKKRVQRAALRGRRSRRTPRPRCPRAPTIRVLESFTSGGAGQAGTREGRQFTVAQNFDFTIAKHMLRAGVQVDGGWWDSNQQTNANGTFTFSSLDGLPGRAAAQLHAARRRSAASTTRSSRPAGTSRTTSASARTSTSASASGRKCRRTSTTSSTSRRARRSPMRCARATSAAATASSTTGSSRASTSRRCASTARIRSTRSSSTRRIPDVDAGAGTSLPASRIQLGPQLTQPTIHQASIGYERPFGEWGNFRTDYMWTRGARHAAVDQRQRADQRRAAGSDGRQRHRDRSTGKRAFDRITVGDDAARAAACAG